MYPNNLLSIFYIFDNLVLCFVGHEKYSKLNLHVQKVSTFKGDHVNICIIKCVRFKWCISKTKRWSTLLIHPIVLETIYLFIVVDWHEFDIRSSSFQSWLLNALHVGMQCDMQGLSGCVHLWWSIGCLSWCGCNNKLLMVESNYEVC